MGKPTSVGSNPPQRSFAMLLALRGGEPPAQVKSCHRVSIEWPLGEPKAGGNRQLPPLTSAPLMQGIAAVWHFKGTALAIVRSTPLKWGPDIIVRLLRQPGQRSRNGLGAGARCSHIVHLLSCRNRLESAAIAASRV